MEGLSGDWGVIDVLELSSFDPRRRLVIGFHMARNASVVVERIAGRVWFPNKTLWN